METKKKKQFLKQIVRWTAVRNKRLFIVLVSIELQTCFHAQTKPHDDYQLPTLIHNL